MENQRAVTMVRLYLPEEGHSVRRAQMEKVLHFRRDQFHVHGITVLAGMTEPGDNHKPHYDTVRDVLRRNPDPPAIIEFFYESTANIPIGRMLREVVPDSHVVYWQATRETSKIAA
jgi:hypothetical protein